MLSTLKQCNSLQLEFLRVYLDQTLILEQAGVFLCKLTAEDVFVNCGTHYDQLGSG